MIMDIRETVEWDKATSRIFDTWSHLLDEGSVIVGLDSRLVGPGGDWDCDEVYIEGGDSGERHTLASSTTTPVSFEGADFDMWEFAREVAGYIAGAQGGEAEEYGRTVTVWL